MIYHGILKILKNKFGNTSNVKMAVRKEQELKSSLVLTWRK